MGRQREELRSQRQDLVQRQQEMNLFLEQQQKDQAWAIQQQKDLMMLKFQKQMEKERWDICAVLVFATCCG